MHDTENGRPTSGKAGVGKGWVPLTPRQALMWADEQLHPGSRRFHLLRLQSPFDVDRDPGRLMDAWVQTIAAHDALRLVVDGSEPRQRFEAEALPILRETLPSGLSPEAWALDFGRRDWDRSRPLFELCLLKIPGKGIASVLRAHALACDERSLAILAAETEARSVGLHAPAAASLADHLAASTATASADREEADAREWSKALADPPPAASLLGCSSTGRIGPLASIKAGLSPEAIDNLEDLVTRLCSVSGDRSGALAIIASTASAAWIHRLSGQQEFVLATTLLPSGNGPAPIGPIERRAFLRVEIAEGESYDTLLAKLSRSWLFAREHGIASLGSDFESAFVAPLPVGFDPSPDSRATMLSGSVATLPGAPEDPATGPDKPSIRFDPAPGSFSLRFDFPVAVFPESTRIRLVSYFKRVLEAMLADSAAGIRVLPLVDEAERDALLELGTGQAVDEVPDILEVISRQTALHPEAPAVEFQGRSVSYAELDRHTNRLARRLVSLGVVKGSRVAVAMPRGFGEFMAILAVLKTGGAYIPVDPAHPVDRVRVILEDAQPQALVRPTQSPIAEALPLGVPSLILDDPLTECPDIDDAPLDIPVDPAQKAYIIFTSGSTGRPKGVEIPRGGISNFIQSVAKTPGLGPSDRLCAISTTTFDMSELDFYLPLCTGGTVVIAERSHALDPVLLRSLLEERKVTAMQATPTTWRMLLDAGWTGHDGFKVFTGGEPISHALAMRLLSCCTELWNLYGPTETSVYSTIDRITAEDKKITVGKAIDNTLITIRDPEGRLAPRFAVGEICIGGKGLALGYYGRPDLTSDLFPTEAATGTRYYRTGDLGRWLPDGRLECLGRVDFQVKVRGFRIEPADIEAHLRTVPGVQDVLVVALKRGEGDPLLVAYWVGPAAKEALIARAKDELPYYMVPSAWVNMESFPLTTSGKVDRKKLPDPGTQPLDENERGTAPRNDQESIVASIWRDILDLPFVPVDEDFFSLGGTSVRVIQMRARLKESFGVEVSLKVLFDKPTVEGIVCHLGDPIEDDTPILSLLGKGEAPQPWIGLMGIQLFDDLALALSGAYSTLGIHVPMRFIPGVDPFPTVQIIAAKYLKSILERQPEGPYWLFGLCHGGIVAFETAAQLEEAGKQVGMVVLLDAELPVARRTLHLLKLGHALKGLFTRPGDLLHKVRAELATRLPLLKGTAGEASTSSDAIPVEIAANEADIDADLKRYQGLGRSLKCQVVTFRATKNDTMPPWSVVTADLGWTGRAGRVRSHDVPSGHLDIVRAPHAAEIASIMKEARREIEKGLD